MVGFGLEYACAHIIILAEISSENLLPIRADFVTERGILPYSLLAIGVFVHERNTIDCVDMKLGCYCTCSDSREGPTDLGGCPPGRLLPTGLSEGHRSRSGSLGEDALQEPRLQHQNGFRFELLH